MRERGLCASLGGSFTPTNSGLLPFGEPGSYSGPAEVTRCPTPDMTSTCASDAAGALPNGGAVDSSDGEPGSLEGGDDISPRAGVGQALSSEDLEGHQDGSGIPTHRFDASQCATDANHQSIALCASDAMVQPPGAGVDEGGAAGPGLAGHQAGRGSGAMRTGTIEADGNHDPGSVRCSQRLGTNLTHGADETCAAVATRNGFVQCAADADLCNPQRGAGRGDGSDHDPHGTPEPRLVRLAQQLIASLPRLDAMDLQQASAHTWSAQLVPLIWCASEESATSALRTMLSDNDRGHGALDAIAAWWRAQGVDRAERAIPILRGIAASSGAGPGPARRAEYLDARVQEEVVARSETDALVQQDLLSRTPAATEPRVLVRWTASQEEFGEDEERRCMTATGNALNEVLAGMSGAERASPSPTAVATISGFLVWLTSSGAGHHMASQILHAHQVGRSAGGAMRRWWAAVGVHSAHRASIYIQGIEQAGMPGDPYGRITPQTTEDVMSAAGADVLLIEDLCTGSSNCADEGAGTPRGQRSTSLGDPHATPPLPRDPLLEDGRACRPRMHRML